MGRSRGRRAVEIVVVVVAITIEGRRSVVIVKVVVVTGEEGEEQY